MTRAISPRSTRRAARALAVLVLVPLHGCDEWTCMTEANYGVTVRVLDVRTGTTIGVVPLGTVTDGPRVDTMLWERGHLHGGDWPGVYDMAVRADGYESWTRRQIPVAKHSCHGVENTAITARLRPVIAAPSVRSGTGAPASSSRHTIGQWRP